MIKTTSNITKAPSALSKMVVSMETYFARRAVYKRTVEELTSLSERELWDLGFCRADIPAIARKAASA